MKRKSKGLALLLALMMLISMNPAIIFAQDTGHTDGTPAVTDEVKTPEDVHKELGEAIGSELDAAQEFFPAPETWEEVGAAVNDAAADAALYETEAIVESTDKLTEKAAEVAEESAKQAGEDASAAEALKGSAVTESENASTYRDQVSGAPSQEAANQKAAQAGEASSQAQVAAGKAIARAQSAAVEEEKARLAYEVAEKAYQVALKESEEKLQAGLIDAEQAKRMTADAKKKAEDAWDFWKEKQTDAEAKAEQAVIDAGEANDALKEQIEILDNAIESTTQEVASDTGTAVVTGSALAAAKAAVAASMIEVTYYEGQIKIVEAETAVVNDLIADAENKITAAEAVVKVTEAALSSARDDYTIRQQELDDARRNLEAAKDAVEEAKQAIKERDESGITAQLNVVRTGDYSASDVHDVAEYLMGPDKEVKWYSQISDVFTVGDKYYKVFVEDVINPKTGEPDRILSIREYFPGEYSDITALPDKERAWKSGNEPGVQITDMVAYKKSFSSEVFLRKTEDGELVYEILSRGVYYTVQENGNGNFSVRINGDDIRIFIKAPDTGDVAADTATIADSWDEATAAESGLVTAQAACTGAAVAKNIAAVVVGVTKIGDDVCQANLKYQNSKKTLLEKVKGKLNDTLLKLDSKLGDPERWVPTEEQEKKLDAAEKAAEEVLDEDAPITRERVKAVGKALLDFSIPAKVRVGVAFYADIAADYAHRKAANELKTAVTEGAATIRDEAKATATAGAEAVSANVKAVDAVVTKEIVDKLASDAEKKAIAADEAAAKAAQAYDDYMYLVEVYGPDHQNVLDAHAAYEAAKGYAEDAKGYANDAKTAAQAAAAAYADAKEKAKNWTPSNSDQDSTGGGATVVDGDDSGSTPDATSSGTGFAAGADASRADTGDHSKTLGWLTTLCTAGFALAKGFINRLKTQN